MSSIGTFKSDEEVEYLLGHKNNGVEKVDVEVKIHKIGSGNHGNHDRGSKKNGEQLRNPEDKADVAVLAELVGGRTASILTGVGETQVSQYKNGKNASNQTDLELRLKLEDRLSFLEEKAVDRVELFMEMIQEEKVKELDADKMATSAEKMVNILDKLRRRNEKFEDKANKPIIHLHGPVMVKADTYLTKEV